MLVSVITASVVTGATGTFYMLIGAHETYARTLVRIGVIAGVIVLEALSLLLLLL